MDRAEVSGEGLIGLIKNERDETLDEEKKDKK